LCGGLYVGSGVRQRPVNGDSQVYRPGCLHLGLEERAQTLRVFVQLFLNGAGQGGQRVRVGRGQDPGGQHPYIEVGRGVEVDGDKLADVRADDDRLAGCRLRPRRSGERSCSPFRGLS
jgi:hypothetical protein